MGLYSSYAEDFAGEMMYPSENLIRVFKGDYPRHSFEYSELKNNYILDVGCGDGRHCVFFNNDLGFNAYGVEPTEKLASIAQKNVDTTGADAEICAGTNRDLPFGEGKFDYLVSWNSCYYMGENHRYDFETHVEEYGRVLKQNGKIVLSIPKPSSFIYQDSVVAEKGYRIIKDDPFGVRDGTVLRRFNDVGGVIDAFSPQFEDFTTASINDDFFGHNYHWWLLIGSRVLGI